MMKSRLFLTGLATFLVGIACATPLPFSGDANCRFIVDSLSSTSGSGSVTCNLIPTPIGNRVMVIQFSDPDPTGTSCGHLNIQDTWLAEVRPEVAWGNCDNVPGATYKLFVGNLSYVPVGATGNEYRTVIKFIDLSAIPSNAVVDSAVLTIKQTWCQTAYADGSAPSGCSGALLTIKAHEVITPWHEKYARWRDMPGFNPTPLDAITVANRLGATLDFNITTAFRAWLTGASSNNGVILIANPLPVNDFFRGRSHDTVCSVQGCNGGQGSPPGADAPKITVMWH